MSNKLLHNFLMKQDNGAIYLDDERIILTPSSVFGTLRKELIEYIGIDRVKGFLLRYGWNLGKYDAKKVLEQNTYLSINELLKQGPVSHMEKGYTKVNTIKTNIESNSEGSIKSVYVEGEWFNSYEAEEHIHQFGITNAPICYTLIGYASGYYSTICGHTVIFKELACKGMGNEYCRYIGKSVHDWNGEVDDELPFYEVSPIVKELERTYGTLLEERNNFSKATDISKRITKQLVDGKNLQFIIDDVFNILNIPILIEDDNFQDYFFTGLSEESLQMIQVDFQEWLKNEQMEQDFIVYSNVQKIQAAKHARLIVPIRVHNKLFGYCSFIYQEEQDRFTDLDYMVLDRLSYIASMHLLNEKTSLEAMERMKGYFLEQLLSGHFSTKKEIIRRGRFINVDLESSYYIAILKHHYTDKSLQKELIFYEELMDTTVQYFSSLHSTVMMGQYAGNSVLLLQIEDGNKDIRNICNQFIAHLDCKYKAAAFQIGISSMAEEIIDINEYYQEALSAIKMTDANRKVVSFHEIGIVGMLLHSKNERVIIQKAKHLLSSLTTKNGTKDTELIKTLYVLLKNGGSLERTMEELALSKTGLRYRIQKIEDSLGLDIRDPETSFQLQLTLQVLILKGELKL